MATKYTAYSEARSIARKRLERLNEAGYVINDIHFPSVKELKERGINPGSALRAVVAFLQAPTTLIEYRKESKKRDIAFRQTEQGVQVGERERIMKRARDAAYRERVRNLTKDEKRLMKGARRLGLNITPSTAAAFAEYVKYRDAQGKGSMKYWFANYQRFLADRSALVSAADAMKSSETAMTADDFNTSWIEFIQERG